MTLDGMPQPLPEETENMGTGETVTQNPTNTHRTDEEETKMSAPTDADAGRETIAQQIPPVYQTTHYGITLSSPMVTVSK